MSSETPRRLGWRAAILLAGFAYFAVGRLFVWRPLNLVAWRWVAWALGAVIFAAHVRFELVLLRSSPRSAALRTAAGAAIGGFLLAATAALVQAMHGSFRPAWILALVAWPALVAIPAFVVALLVGVMVNRLRTAPGAPPA